MAGELDITGEREQRYEGGKEKFTARFEATHLAILRQKDKRRERLEKAREEWVQRADASLAPAEGHWSSLFLYAHV